MADEVVRRGSIVDTNKSFWEKLWPVIACGAGLFSDGYLNGVSPVYLDTDFQTSGLTISRSLAP